MNTNICRKYFNLTKKKKCKTVCTLRMPSVMYFTTVSDFDKDENIIFFEPGYRGWCQIRN